MSKSEASQPAPSLPKKIADSPLQLVVYPQSGEPEEGIVLNAPPVKLCHGAKHRLQVTAPDGSTWVEQELCLLWKTDQPGPYGLSADPPFLVVSTPPTEDEMNFQHLSGETGAHWTLTAAGGTAAQSGEALPLALGSYWQAPHYAFRAEVGDFHYAVATLEWDNVVPIVEPHVSTILTATVTSPFDDARVMSGKPVWFELNGKRYQTPRVTGEDGKAHLSYTPEPEDIGADNRVIFHAYCVDELGVTSEKKELKVPAFAGDAWPDQLKVEFCDEKGVPIDPTVLGVRLTRGGKFTLTVKPDAGSFYVDQPIKLVWPDNRAQLGIELVPSSDEPEHGRPLPEAGLSWNLRGGDESGQFSLMVEVAVLPMPFLLKGVQMSANLVFEAELSYDPHVPGLPPIFQRGVPKAVRIKPKPGSPLGLMALRATLKFVSLEDDDLTSGQVPATPSYGEPSEVLGESGVAWSLKASGSGIGGRFGLEIEMPGFKDPLKVREAFMMSSNLGNEAKVIIDSLELSNQPLVLRREKQHVVTLVPRESKNSPLGKTGLRGRLIFTKGSLTDADLIAAPPYKDWQAMSEEGLGWTLTGQKISGTCNLEIEVEGFATSVVLENVLVLSETLSDEAEVKINGEPGSTLLLRHEVPCTVSVVPKVGSPLGLKGYSCSMSFHKGSLDHDSVATSTPYGVERKLEVGGLEWTLTGKKVSGTFSLDIDVKNGFKDPLKLADAILLSEDLNDEAYLDIALSAPEVPPIFQASVEKTVRIVPKEGSPLALANLVATLHFDQREDQLTASRLKPKNLAYGKASPPLTSEGFTWTIGPNNSRGEFGLHVTVSEFSTVLRMEKGYLMSSHLGNDVRVYLDGVELGAKGAVLRRKRSHTLTMVPRDDSGTPIGRTGLKGWIEFIPGSLSEDKVAAKPGYGNKVAVAPSGLSWTLEGEALSGTCALNILVEGFATPRRIELVRLLSEHLHDEVDVTFDDAAVGTPMILRRQTPHKMKVVPKVGSPLREVKEDCWMTFKNGSLTADKVTANPAYTHKRPMTSTGLEWTLTGEIISGTFGLGLHSPLFPEMDVGQGVLLSSNLGDELELTVGGKSENENPFFWRGEDTKVALRLKKDSPLNGNIDLITKLEFLKSGALEKGQVTATPNYGAGNAGPASSLSWTLKGPADKSGVFGLEVSEAGFKNPARLENVALLSRRLEDEVYVEPVPLTVYYYGNLKLHVRPGSPIEGLGLRASAYKSGGAQEVGLDFDPPGDVDIQSGMKWMARGLSEPGHFEACVEVKDFRTQIFIRGMVIHIVRSGDCAEEDGGSE